MKAPVFCLFIVTLVALSAPAALGDDPPPPAEGHGALYDWIQRGIGIVIPSGHTPPWALPIVTEASTKFELHALPNRWGGEQVDDGEYRHERYDLSLRPVPGSASDDCGTIKKIQIESTTALNKSATPQTVTVNSMQYTVTWLDDSTVRVEQSDHDGPPRSSCDPACDWHDDLLDSITVTFEFEELGQKYIACRAGLVMNAGQKEPDLDNPGSNEGEWRQNPPSDAIEYREPRDEAYWGTDLWGAFRVKVDVVEVDVLLVPQYLYADSTGYVPVKFKVYGRGSGVQIRNPVTTTDDSTVRVTWKHADGTTVFTCDAKFAASEESPSIEPGGFGDRNNGQSCYYTAWIPNSHFTVQIVNGDKAKTTFVFLVKLDAYDALTEEWATLESSFYDVQAWPEVYGDPSVQVVEVGEDETWSAYDTATKQNATDRERTVDYQHVAGTLHSGSPGYPHPTVPVPKKQGDCYIVSHDFDDYSNTSTPTNNSRKVYVRLYDDSDWSGITSGEQVRNRAYGESVGCWFGCSYKLKDVAVVAGKGMRLDDASKENNGFQLLLFTDGKATFTIAEINNPSDFSTAGVAASLFTIGWGLASTGWGAPLGVAAGIAGLFMSIDINSVDSAAAVCYTMYNHGHPTTASPPAFRVWLPQKRITNGTETVDLPMDRDSLVTNVGDTWCFYVNPIAVCQAESAGIGSEDVKATCEYYVTSKAFNASDAVTIDFP